MDHSDHQMTGSTNTMAISATLHCLTGCAIGEIAGLMIGTSLGLGNLATLSLAIALAFLFGYTLRRCPSSARVSASVPRWASYWLPTRCRSRRWSSLTTQ